MEVLNALISRADFWSLFKPLAVQGIRHQASLYVDDPVVFVSPEPQDIQLLRNVLSIFEEAFELAYNLGKCQMTPVPHPVPWHSFIGNQVTQIGIPTFGGQGG
jgi:hypothetical protein